MGNRGTGGIPGLCVAGRYRLVELIGRGGMGRVWRAVDDILDRLVAIKEMRIDGLDAEDARTRRARALREARATARIDHPNVVRVYDVVDEGDRLWIVMELVDGRSLEQVLAEDGPLRRPEAARIGLGLAAALRQVHAVGVLHRDIKPGNVLIENRNAAAGNGNAPAGEGNAPAGNQGRRIVLTDFGIAAVEDAQALTVAGMIVGSPDYMAPERVSGRPQGPPSDLWSLGATLCAALGEGSPFSRATTLATLHAVLYEEPELPEEAAGPLYDLLSGLLRKAPDDRPALDEVEAALEPVAFPRRTPTLRETTAPEPAEPAEPFDQAARDAASGAGGGGAPSPGTLSPPETLDPRPRPSPRPPYPDRPWWRRTAVLTGVAGAVVAGAVLAVLLATSPGGKAQNPRDSQNPNSRDTGGTPSATIAPYVPDTPTALPSGAVREGPYAWVPPHGWQRDVRTAAEVHYTAPDGDQEVGAKTSITKGDLLESWQRSELNAHQGQAYRKIRLERTVFRGRPAVVWEYTFTYQGVRWHAVQLAFDQKGRTYEISTWYRPDVERRALGVYEQVKRTFTVL